MEKIQIIKNSAIIVKGNIHIRTKILLAEFNLNITHT